MRRIGLLISLLVAVLAMSACESESNVQTAAHHDQKAIKQSMIKSLGSKKKQDFQTLSNDMQLAVVFSSMVDVSETFDYGIGNPEYFIRSSMTEEEADIAKKNLESIKLENGRLKKQNREAFAMLQKTRNQEKSRNENQQLKDNRDTFFEITGSMIALINQVTPKNAKQTRKQLDQLKKQYTKYNAESISLMNGIVKKQGADKESFERHLEALLQKQSEQTVLSEGY
ncbi:hypothetical protein [Bacillus halotolerans]|uniref:hypothetical protein n=1 Tax=Bacillus halotolerans TaxID=260554 RepID=UPI00351923E6